MIDVAIRLENMSEIEQKLDKLNANAANEIKKAKKRTRRRCQATVYGKASEVFGCNANQRRYG